MNHSEHPSKTPSPRTGIFALLGGLLRGQGTGAPEITHESGASSGVGFLGEQQPGESSAAGRACKDLADFGRPHGAERGCFGLYPHASASVSPFAAISSSLSHFIARAVERRIIADGLPQSSMTSPGLASSARHTALPIGGERDMGAGSEMGVVETAERGSGRDRARFSDRAPAVGRQVAFALVAVCVMLTWGVEDASAALRFPFDGQIEPSSGGAFGSFEANSVAVDDLTGNAYVADSGSGTIDVFEASTGTQLGSLDGALTPAGSFGGGEVAVATNNGTGDVYVVDSTDNVVDEFDSSGSYLCQITGSSTPSATECNGPTGSKTPAEHFSTPSGVAVDQATGEVYVVDARNSVIDVFSAAGAYVSQISLGSIPGEFSAGETHGVAVSDFNHDVYVADAGRDLVSVFDAAGDYLETWSGSNTPAESFGRGYVSVAVDDTSGDVYVTDSTHAVVDVFASSGAYLTGFTHSFRQVRAVTVGQASHKVYVSDNTEVENSQPSLVDVFGPPLVIPDLTTGVASEIKPTSATLNGTVNADGINKVTDCHFDYGTTTSYGSSAPCVETVGAGTSSTPVHAPIATLQAGTTYHFRLVASNSNGTSFGEDATFSTPPPPSIDSASATNVTASSADLNAKINPNGFDTTYRFEWGKTSAYGTIVPVPDGDIGAGTSDVPVSMHLARLEPNTTYHWRIVARNQNGLAIGSSSDHTFVYEIAGTSMPGGRAYEMVTPPKKDGALIGDVLIGLKQPDIAEDGSRMIMSSIQCFAEAAACNGARQNEGELYAFSRTSSDWQTTPLAPSAAEFAGNTPWGVSADTGSALFSMPTQPAGEDNFYARQPEGSFTDIGPVTPASAGAEYGVSTLSSAEATADVSHVAWESVPVWPFDSGSYKSVYEYAGAGNSAPALVGVSGGVGSTDLISTCGTELGGGASATKVYNSLSADGRTVIFTALACPSGSGANTGHPVVADTLYARIEGSRTVSISGRSLDECTTPTCISSVPAHAQFAGASMDGSKVFFTSTQQLTNDASQDEQSSDSSSNCSATSGTNGCNLYEYDSANPAGRNLLAVSAGDTSGRGPRVQGIMAISSDGSHVYFVAQGVLTGTPNHEGEKAQDGVNNFYVFERDASFPAGHVAFIAALPGTDGEEWSRGIGQANVTPDGSFLVFTSHGTLTPDDVRTDGALQVFDYDAASGELTRISIGEHGFNDNGNAGTGEASIVPAEYGFQRDGPPRTDPTMSHDGAYVFFQSPIGLVPRALNDVPIDSQGDLAENVYEWHEGQVYLISDGKDVSRTEGVSSVLLYGTDASGANVFFRTADQLVPQDTDTQDDIYDARICTPSSPCIGPPPEPAPPCQGGACQGMPSAPPPEPGGRSAAFTGFGNLLTKEPAGRATVTARSVGRGATFLLVAVKVSGKGRIVVTGTGIKAVARAVSEAGTYRVRVALTSRVITTLRRRHKRRRHKLTLRLRIAFTPANGAARTTANLSVKAGR